MSFQRDAFQNDAFATAAQYTAEVSESVTEGEALAGVANAVVGPDESVGIGEAASSQAAYKAGNWISPRRFLITPASTGTRDLFYDLSLAPADFWSHVRSDGGDIRVTTQDGITQCAREVSGFNLGSEIGSLFFSTNEGTAWWVYYGSGEPEPDPDSTYGRRKVWDSDTLLVVHLEDLTDSGPLNNTMANGGSTEVAGKVGGKARAFTGGQYIDTGLLPTETLDEYTCCFWFKGSNCRSAVRQQDPAIPLWICSGYNGVGYAHHIQSNDYSYTDGVWVDGWTGGVPGSGAPYNGAILNNGNWHRVVHARKRNTTNGFRAIFDGAPADYKNSNDTPIPQISVSYEFGRVRNGTEVLEGALDEVRIYKRFLSDAELAVEYANQSDPASFWTTGSYAVDPEAESVGESAAAVAGFQVQVGGPFRFLITPAADDPSDLMYDLALAPAEFWDHVRDDGGDIRVTTFAEASCAREVVGFDPITHTGRIFFSTNGASSFWICFGSGEPEPDPDSAYGRKAVWSGHVAVYHMEDNSDAGAGGYDLTGHRTQVSGKLGQAHDYDDSSVDYDENTSLQAGGGSITLSFWLYQATVDLVNSSSIEVGATDTSSDRISIHCPWSDGNIYWDYGDSSGVGRISCSFSGYFDKWTHVVALFNEATGLHAVYLDGQLAASSTNANKATLRAHLRLATFYGIYFADQSLDEVKIKQAATSPEAIAAEYACQNDPGSFWTTGATEGTEIVAISESLGAGTAYSASPSEAVSEAEAVAAMASLYEAPAEAVGLDEQVANMVAFNPSPAESVDVGEQASVAAHLLEGVSEGVSVAEAAAASAHLLESVAEGVGVGESVSNLLCMVEVLLETVHQVAALRAHADFAVAAGEAIGLAEVLAAGILQNAAVSESVSVAEAAAAILDARPSLAESVAAGEGLESLAELLLELAEAVGAGEAVVASQGFPAQPAEAVGLDEQAAAGLQARVGVAETIWVGEAISVRTLLLNTRPVAFFEGICLTAEFSGQCEAPALSGALMGPAEFSGSITED